MYMYVAIVTLIHQVTLYTVMYQLQVVAMWETMMLSTVVDTTA